MKSKLKWLVLVAIVASTWAVWKHHRSKEIRYHGVSIERWFDELNSDRTTTNEARAAFLAMGSDAVAFLISQLTNAPAFREDYLHYKEQLPWAFRKKLPAVPMVNWNRRERAALMLGDLGPTAKEALPALINLVSYMDRAELPAPSGSGATVSNARMCNPRVRVAAFVAMEQININDPRVLPAIITALKEGTYYSLVPNPTAARAVQAFEHVASPSDEMILNLLRTLEERYSDVYQQELGVFWGTLIPGGSIGHSFHEIYSVTNTFSALTSADRRAREAAAFKFGDPDREGYNRHATSRALPQLSDEVVTNLVKCLRDPVEGVRLNAAGTLAKLKQSEDKVLPTVVSLLDSTNSLYRLRSIEILRQLGKNAQPALPRLAVMKSDPVGFLSRWADRATKEIQ